MTSEVRNNPEKHRYEIHSDGEVAGFTTYVRRADVVVLTHTEVDDRFAGQGLGSALARGVLDAIRESGLHVVAQCPFVARYIRTHQEKYADLSPPPRGG